MASGGRGCMERARGGLGRPGFGGGEAGASRSGQIGTGDGHGARAMSSKLELPPMVAMVAAARKKKKHGVREGEKRRRRKERARGEEEEADRRGGGSPKLAGGGGHGVEKI